MRCSLLPTLLSHAVGEANDAEEEESCLWLVYRNAERVWLYKLTGKKSKLSTSGQHQYVFRSVQQNTTAPQNLR